MHNIDSSFYPVIANKCHEINRIYCMALGDYSQVPWSEAPDWQRQSALKGVEFVLNNPDAGPEENHNSWLKQKEADGWVYGETKDENLKTHPCMVPFNELPLEQQIKDKLFKASVESCLDLFG